MRIQAVIKQEITKPNHSIDMIRLCKLIKCSFIIVILAHKRFYHEYLEFK